jgi:PAS domain S-box-containing protein
VTLNYVPAFPRAEEKILEIFADNKNMMVVSKGLLQAILDNLPFNILVFDDHSKIVFINKNLCNLIGYSKDELLDLTMEQYVKRVITEDYDFSRYPQILSGKTIKNYTYTLKHKNGNKIPVRYNSYPLKVEPNNNTIGCLIIIEALETENQE